MFNNVNAMGINAMGVKAGNVITHKETRFGFAHMYKMMDCH